MRNTLLLLGISFLFITLSCNSTENQKTEELTTTKEEIVETKKNEEITIQLEEVKQEIEESSEKLDELLNEL